MLLIGVFAGIALLLAATGIYGVIAYVVAGRSREIGIRIALGARRAGVLRRVLWDGGRLVVAGLLIGLLAARATSHLLASMLYGLSPSDPVTFAGIAAVVAVVATSAILIPARRASRLDPMRVLREE